MRIPCLLLLLLCASATTNAQIPPPSQAQPPGRPQLAGQAQPPIQSPPAGTIAPEDAAFNTAYATRHIPTVTGKLLNITPEELKKLSLSYTLVTPFSQFQVTRVAVARPDGSFSLQLDYALPYQQIWFSVGEVFYAGLCANTDLYLELDMSKITAANEVFCNGDGVTYGGTDGPLNVYLNNYVLYKRSDQLRLSGNIMTLSSSRSRNDSVVQAYNTLFDSAKQIEDSYIAANPSPYGWILENERLSDYYGDICIRHWGRTMAPEIWQQVRQHKSYIVSNSGTLFYKYLATYIGHMPGGTPPSIDRSIQRIDSLFQPAKADYLKLRLGESTDIGEQKTALESTLNSMHTDWCIAVTKKEWKRTAAKLDEINKTLASSAASSANSTALPNSTPSANSTALPNSAASGTPPTFGKPLLDLPFGATMYKAENIKALDFIAKLKLNFPGKAIIIDRWATWCAPCLGEMPHARELQDSSKDLPVVFVYLCTINGSTESKWKSKVAELQQPGIHFLIDATLDADLSSYFSFSGYPGHALIDKSGHYKPGAIQWMSQIENKEALAALIDQ
jgi:thiol-disulfide isomerase/thioredoxin